MTENDQPTITAYDASAWQKPPQGRRSPSGKNSAIKWLAALCGIGLIAAGIGYAHHVSYLRYNGVNPALEAKG